jgi:hypothetical protein
MERPSKARTLSTGNIHDGVVALQVAVCQPATSTQHAHEERGSADLGRVFPLPYLTAYGSASGFKWASLHPSLPTPAFQSSIIVLACLLSPTHPDPIDFQSRGAEIIKWVSPAAPVYQ